MYTIKKCVEYAQFYANRTIENRMKLMPHKKSRNMIFPVTREARKGNAESKKLEGGEGGVINDLL